MIQMTKSLLLGCLLLLLGCSGSDKSGERKEGGPPPPEMPRFAEESLAKGRGIWMGTCRNCHLLGISGAPAVTDYKAWEPRIGKGKAALYQSALNGIKGPDGKYRMPPHGGNTQLKDEQVRQAVDYMVASVKRLAGQ
jgi:cytochrome c5